MYKESFSTHDCIWLSGGCHHSPCSNWCNLLYCRQWHTNKRFTELRTAEQVMSSVPMQQCSHEWSVDSTLKHLTSYTVVMPNWDLNFYNMYTKKQPTNILSILRSQLNIATV